MKKWRLILSGYNDPYANMAIDEALCRRQADPGALPVVRIYGWEPASFSLGYFQKPESLFNLKVCRQENISFVRRFTGGEIIFHKDDLTYSVCCRRDDLGIFGSIDESYKIISGFILEAYRSLGLEAEFFSAVKTFKQKESPTGALCFSSKEGYDITIQEKKIGGSAQRRRKKVIFQHGSIPLKMGTNLCALFLNDDISGIDNKVISLEEALGRPIHFGELSEALIVSFTKVFNVDLQIACLDAQEVELSGILIREKYRNPEWNLYRKNTLFSTVEC
ncbi:MAG: lipoate--protein ligase family protein [Candidatus Omnitrophota bacterium]